MTYRGKFRGGVVVLEPGVRLQEGSDVIVEPAQPGRVQAASPRSPRIMRNGVPVFPRNTSTSKCSPGLDLVNQLRDETL